MYECLLLKAKMRKKGVGALIIHSVLILTGRAICYVQEV